MSGPEQNFLLLGKSEPPQPARERSHAHGRMVAPTISMRAVLDEDGSYAAELRLTGLTSEQQAQAALRHFQNLFCSEEIQSQ